MNRVEFDAFVEQVRARGFTRVLTGAGPQPIEEWRPYGAFDGGNPGIEKHLGGFEWITGNQALDHPPPGACKSSIQTNGVWTFIA